MQPWRCRHPWLVPGPPATPRRAGVRPPPQLRSLPEGRRAVLRFRRRHVGPVPPLHRGGLGRAGQPRVLVEYQRAAQVVHRPFVRPELRGAPRVLSGKEAGAGVHAPGGASLLRRGAESPDVRADRRLYGNVHRRGPALLLRPEARAGKPGEAGPGPRAGREAGPRGVGKGQGGRRGSFTGEKVILSPGTPGPRFQSAAVAAAAAVAATPALQSSSQTHNASV